MCGFSYVVIKITGTWQDGLDNRHDAWRGQKIFRKDKPWRDGGELALGLKKHLASGGMDDTLLKSLSIRRKELMWAPWCCVYAADCLVRKAIFLRLSEEILHSETLVFWGTSLLPHCLLVLVQHSRTQIVQEVPTITFYQGWSSNQQEKVIMLDCTLTRKNLLVRWKVRVALAAGTITWGNSRSCMVEKMLKSKIRTLICLSPDLLGRIPWKPSGQNRDPGELMIFLGIMMIRNGQTQQTAKQAEVAGGLCVWTQRSWQNSNIKRRNRRS